MGSHLHDLIDYNRIAFLQSLEWGRTFSSLRSMAGLVGHPKKGKAGEGSDAARRLGRAFARFRGFVTH